MQKYTRNIIPAKFYKKPLRKSIVNHERFAESYAGTNKYLTCLVPQPLQLFLAGADIFKGQFALVKISAEITDRSVGIGVSFAQPSKSFLGIIFVTIHGNKPSVLSKEQTLYYHILYNLSRF